MEPTFILCATSDLTLKLRQAEDAPSYFAFIQKNREHLAPWMPWLDGVEEVNDTLEYIQVCQENFKRDGSLDLGILYAGEWAGSVGFTQFQSDTSIRIGYWLGQEFQGKGIMTQSVQTLMDYAAAVYGTTRFEISCAVENTRSRAVAERLGFTEIRKEPRGEWHTGHFVESIVYSKSI